MNALEKIERSLTDGQHVMVDLNNWERVGIKIAGFKTVEEWAKNHLGCETLFDPKRNELTIYPRKRWERSRPPS